MATRAAQHKISLQNDQRQFQSTGTLRIIGLGGSSTLIAQYLNHVTVDVQGVEMVSFT
ncbi:MAG TPA: hypothetical protein VNT27_13475 [Propionibacteriaceae bacterium]|nr:hypothetical protein [Propionibacteriaceae bacterium]